MNKIVIWAPRYHDKKVLIAKHKVQSLNHVVITKAPAYNGTYVISGATIRSYPLESNGKIDCYAVPVGELERVK